MKHYIVKESRSGNDENVRLHNRRDYKTISNIDSYYEKVDTYGGHRQCIVPNEQDNYTASHYVIKIPAFCGKI